MSVLARIQRFFAAEEGTDDGLDVELAAAALLVEVAWADHEIDPRESQVARSQLRLLLPEASEAELNELLARAREAQRAATALYPFTRAVNALASHEEKRRLLTAMWRVALADGAIEPLEEHLVRRLAGLLHLRHGEFIAAKMAARRAAGEDS